MTSKISVLAVVAVLPLLFGSGAQATAGEKIKISGGHHAAATRAKPSSRPPSARNQQNDGRSADYGAGRTTAAPVYPPPAPGEPGGNDRGELSIARNYQYRTNDQKLKLCERRRIDASLGDHVPADIVRQCRLGAYVATGKRY